METKQLLQINAVVFGIVALLHLWRSFAEWPAQIGDFMLPVWASYIAVIVAAWLAYANYSAK
ncbi:MAG: hypothetical protein QW331_02130 [Candidatus Woesearchaeota archaeon]